MSNPDVPVLSHGLVDLHERELVWTILHEWRTLYDIFDFVVRDALGSVPRPGWDYLFFGQVPRTDVGLSRLGQPGDIDVLIIPTRERRAYLGLAAAVEVKRLALRGPNWTKNVDRYGITQAHGLADAGFPYVGILHLIVCAEGPPENHADCQIARYVDPEKDIVEIVGPARTDMTGYLAADRQYSRLCSQSLRPEVGINCIALDDTVGPEGRSWVHSTPGRTRTARRNPKVNTVLMGGLRDLIKSFGGRVPPRNYDLRGGQKNV